MTCFVGPDRNKRAFAVCKDPSNAVNRGSMQLSDVAWGVEMVCANVKRSIVLHGRKTSISLEDDFWQGLKEIAAAENKTIMGLVEDIAGQRISANLSSSIRVFLFRRFHRPDKSAGELGSRGHSKAR